jgi:chromosomal replication initiation ATPase DnaA
LWNRCRSARSGLSRKTGQRLCDLVVLATAVAFAVPVGELIATSRRPPYVAFARQSAMYLAHVAFGLTYSEIGQAFGRDRTTAAHACRLIEERRDDPSIDAMLATLESACAALRCRLGAATPMQQLLPQVQP